jgi:hypothetical protein
MDVNINRFNGLNIKINISKIDITVHKHTCLVAFVYSIIKLFVDDIVVDIVVDGAIEFININAQKVFVYDCKLI